MYFLVDHENVNNSGYQGVEYLLPEDTIEIFYSESSKNIHNGIFRLIKDSGCDIKICKLKQVRKNALDFYIVSRLGELIGSGYQGNSAIISGDHGFKSVQEYWRNCTKHKRRIGLALSVADAIIAMNEPGSRTGEVKMQMKPVSIETEFARYEENEKVRRQLAECFRDTEYIGKLDEIERIFIKKGGNKTLYLDSLKQFGKRDGVVVYNRMKGLVM